MFAFIRLRLASLFTHTVSSFDDFVRAVRGGGESDVKVRAEIRADRMKILASSSVTFTTRLKNGRRVVYREVLQENIPIVRNTSAVAQFSISTFKEIDRRMKDLKARLPRASIVFDEFVLLPDGGRLSPEDMRERIRRFEAQHDLQTHTV